MMSGGSFLQDHRPATFEDRGVTVPLTSASTAGARLRARGPNGPTFILAERGGGHGWTVAPLAFMGDLYDLTLYDRMLVRALVGIVDDGGPIGPADVRAAARRVAATGVCGRVARRAARLARERTSEDALVVRFLLALGLVAELGVEVAEWGHLSPDDPELGGWLGDTAARAARAMGVEASAAEAALARLAGLIEPLGMARSPGRARLEVALETLEAFAASVREYAERERGEEGVVAGQVAAVAGVCADAAARALSDARDRTGGVRALVDGWLTRPDEVRAALILPEWLMDGWDAVCALWNEAEANGRDACRSIMPSLQRMTPMPPLEVFIGAGVSAPDGAEIWYQGRWMNAGDDDRGERARLDHVCRHEILRAHTA